MAVLLNSFVQTYLLEELECFSGAPVTCVLLMLEAYSRHTPRQGSTMHNYARRLQLRNNEWNEWNWLHYVHGCEGGYAGQTRIRQQTYVFTL